MIKKSFVLRCYMLWCISPAMAQIPPNVMENTAPPAVHSLSASEIYEKVSPFVVKIQTYDEWHNELALGAGVILETDHGYRCTGDPWHETCAVVATNYHVIEVGTAATVVLKSGAECEAGQVYYEDPQADLAIFEISCSVKPGGGMSVTEAPLPKIGDRVFTIGHPGGLDNSISDGLISGIREVQDKTVLQISAPISPGSSGGPVLDVEGRLIGLATSSSVSGQNLNFAVPAASLQALCDQERESEGWRGWALVGRSYWEGASITHRVPHPELLKIVGKSESPQTELIARAANEEGDAKIACLEAALRLPSSKWEFLAHYALGMTKGYRHEKGATEERLESGLYHFEKSYALKSDFSPTLRAMCVRYYLYNSSAKWENVTPKWGQQLIWANRLVDAEPRYSLGYRFRGNAFQNIGQIEDAISDYKTAIKFAPYDPDSYDELASCYASVERLELAIKTYKQTIEVIKALEENPQYPDGLKLNILLGTLTLIHVKIGRCHAALRQWDLAVNALTSALHSNSKDPQSRDDADYIRSLEEELGSFRQMKQTP